MATEVGTADTDLLVFKGKNLQDYKVVELKRFLEERGLKKSGKKIELCERLRRYLVNEALDGPAGHRRPNSDSTSSAKGTHQGRGEFYASFSARIPDVSQINRSSNRRIYSVVKSFVILFNKHMKKRFIGKRMCLSCPLERQEKRLLNC